MTLVIAGYCKNDEFFERGLYFAADSHITQGDQVVVKGFKKVIELQIRVKNPLFLGQWFNKYYGNIYESSCVVAFAGHTLVAQHFINSISNHLSELYFTHTDGSYQVVMSCQRSKHLKSNEHCPEDMFLPRDFDNVLTGEYLSKVVAHAIDAALDDARSFDAIKNLFSAYKAEFIFGVKCPTTNQHQIYQYGIIPDDKRGAKVNYHLVKVGELALIGDKSFETSALIALQHSAKAVSASKTLYNLFNQAQDNESLKRDIHTDEPRKAVSESKIIYNFLNQTIDNENLKGNMHIGKPSVLYNLDGNVFKRIGFTK